MNNLKQNTYLTKCHFCKKEIHKSSKICPYCGLKKPWYKKPGTLIINAILAFFIIGLFEIVENVISNIENNTVFNQTLKESTIEYIPFNLIQGVRELKENELKFKENYDEKYVETSGVIKSFEEDFSGKPYVTIELGDEFIFELLYAKFKFKDSEIDKLLNLKNGDTVKVKGVLKLYDTVFEEIEVKNCEIVE